MMNSRLASPICVAARPTPGAAYMVSAMSSISVWSSATEVGDRLARDTQPLVGVVEDLTDGHGN